VIAKAIARAVNARRPAARYVAPWSTNFVLLFRAIAPTFVWDWAMRKVGFLSMKHLEKKAQDVKPLPRPETPAPHAAAN
jgi:hypothetical protein